MAKLKIASFLTGGERADIERAVAEAESSTAGEIKVLVVQRSKGRLSPKSPFQAVEDRAIREFNAMGIADTRDDTGVLIMISLAERMVNVKADEAINEKVDPETWQEIVNLILRGIRAETPGRGICNAVRQVGNLLSEHFPIKPDDVNELSNGVEFKE